MLLLHCKQLQRVICIILTSAEYQADSVEPFQMHTSLSDSKAPPTPTCTRVSCSRKQKSTICFCLHHFTCRSSYNYSLPQWHTRARQGSIYITVQLQHKMWTRAERGASAHQPTFQQEDQSSPGPRQWRVLLWHQTTARTTKIEITGTTDTKHTQPMSTCLASLNSNSNWEARIKNLRILSFNESSLVNKLGLLEQLFMVHHPHIVFTIEAWLYAGVRDSKVIPSSYKLLRKDRGLWWGDVATIIKRIK